MSADTSESGTLIVDTVQALVDEETRAWDTQDVERLLVLFHPDMVWPFPPTSSDHDPVTWFFELGRFCPKRWGDNWGALFRDYELVHNRRETVRILPTTEGDGAMAVVDVDTLWRHRETQADFHWKGRCAKIYVLTDEGCKMMFQHGLLDFKEAEQS